MSVQRGQLVTFGRSARCYHYDDPDTDAPKPICESSGPNADPVVPRKRVSVTNLRLCAKCRSIDETGVNPRDRGGSYKLGEEQKREIAHRYETESTTYQDLADEYSVSYATAWRAANEYGEDSDE